MNVSDKDKELYNRYSREMAEWAEWGEPEITVTGTKMGLFCLIGQVQLAMRHPLNSGASRKLAETQLRSIIDQLDLPPAVQRVVEMGWDPSTDVAWPKDEAQFQGD